MNLYAMVDYLDRMRRAPKSELEVFDCVSRYYSFDSEILKSNSGRYPPLVKARQMSWMLIYHSGVKISAKRLAACYGGFDHTTVLYGVKTMRNRVETEPDTRREYYDLCAALSLPAFITPQIQRI